MVITDEQWATLEPLIPKKQPIEDGKRRPWVSHRDVLNSILWVRQTGAAWQDLPKRYPSPATCHRRFQEWRREGGPENILQTLAKNLKECGKLDLSKCFTDGFFSYCKKGADSWKKTKRGKGTKVMAVADRSGLPIAILFSPTAKCVFEMTSSKS